jgi:hypothetical protein
MIRSRQVAACSIVVLASLSVQSCAVHRTLTSAEVLAPPADAGRYTRFATPRGQAVQSYVTRDGVTHPFDGRASLENDTLVFRTEASADRMEARERGRIERVAVADLQSVQSEAVDPARSIALGLAVALGAVLIMALTIESDGVWFY